MSDAFPINDLGGLVEAATAAADRELSWADTGTTSAGQFDNDLANHALHHTGRSPDHHRRSSPPGSRKRKLAQVRDTSSQEYYTAYEEREDVLRDEQEAEEGEDEDEGSYDPLAATLWREPIRKEGSRTSRRPPMANLYSGVGLCAENFLKLQADAKAFMLDENHLDRREVVSKRGKGDHADRARLKLMKCIEEFLDDGFGEKYFGPDTKDNKGSNYPTVWPDDKDHILTQCMPLCRRMVTNEIQRVYAIEKRQRKSKCKKSELEKKSAANISDVRLENIPDILGDDCIPDTEDATKFFRDYQKVLAMIETKKRLGINPEELGFIVANIYGHYKLFHADDSKKCDVSCIEPRIEKLRAWAAEQRKKRDSAELHDGPQDHHLSLLFEMIRVDVKKPLLLEMMRGVQEQQLQPPGQEQHRPPGAQQLEMQSSKGLDSSSAAEIQKTQQQHPPQPETQGTLASRIPLNKPDEVILHINVISRDFPDIKSAKRLIPRFTLGTESAKGLAQLTGEVEQRYNAVRHNDAGRRQTRMDFNVKVWLPDGLVHVKDDGEWMVALLRAGMVDWMDGEIRVLIEV